MAYRCGNRLQMILLPKSIAEYVAEEDPVRVYDAFVDALDLSHLGIDVKPNKVGNSEYSPRAMLKLLVYGYSYGVKSSRKLEREVHHNLSFIWLMGGLKPDHKTIAEFRRRNKAALQRVLKQCVRLCVKLDLIAGNVLFVDGTKIRANASSSQTHDKPWYQSRLAELDQRIDQLLDECENLDHDEDHQGSLVSITKALVSASCCKEAIVEVLAQFDATAQRKINLTDPDCANMRSPQGKHASYNVQTVVDDHKGLIVHAEAVNDPTDLNQFAQQIEQAHEVLGKACESACADAGYADTAELEKIDAQGVQVIVPSQRQALRQGPKPFGKQDFRYDPQADCYYCPEGHRLKWSSTYPKTGNRYYTITDKQLCFACRHWGRCTASRFGRRVVRLHNEPVKEKLEAQYEQPDCQRIYARRKARVEHPFGHIKRNLKTDSFLMRGREGVQAEASILSTCFNLARMITIKGVFGLIRGLSLAAA